MTKPKYQKLASLNQEDLDRFEKLKAKGIKFIEVVRRGIQEMEKQTQNVTIL